MKAIDVKASPEQFQALDAIADRALNDLLAAQGSFSKAFAVSTAMNELRDALSPLMGHFMKLQNTPLGFKTDKPEGGYPEAVVRDAVIEGTLRGVQTVGNQFNIISSRCYITKEGYEYKLQKLKGLSKLKITIGIPKMRDGGAIVDCKATWAFNGVDDSKEAEIPVRVNAGMGADAIIGKSQRKFMKRIFEQIMGSPDPGDEDLESGQLQDVKTERTLPSNLLPESRPETPHAKVTAWLAEIGFAWPALHAVLLDTGILKDPVKSPAELTEAVCHQILTAKSGLLAQMQQAKGAAQ